MASVLDVSPPPAAPDCLRPLASVPAFIPVPTSSASSASSAASSATAPFTAASSASSRIQPPLVSTGARVLPAPNCSAPRRSNSSPASGLVVGFPWGSSHSPPSPITAASNTAAPVPERSTPSPRKPPLPLGHSAFSSATPAPTAAAAATATPTPTTADPTIESNGDSLLAATGHAACDCEAGSSSTPQCLAPPHVKIRHHDPPLFSSLFASSLPPSPHPADAGIPHVHLLSSQSDWPPSTVPATLAEPPSWSSLAAIGGSACAAGHTPYEYDLPGPVTSPSSVLHAPVGQAESLSISSLSSPDSTPVFQTPLSTSPLYDGLPASTSAPPTSFSSFCDPNLRHHALGASNWVESSRSSLSQTTAAASRAQLPPGAAAEMDADEHHLSQDAPQPSSIGTDDHEPVSPATAEQQRDAGLDRHGGETGGGGDGGGGDGGGEPVNSSGSGKPRRDTKGLPRQFACTVCGAAFARNHDLRRHARIHMVNKPYACPTCRKQFSRKDALNRHLSVKSNCLFRRRSSAATSSQPPVLGIAPHHVAGGDATAATDAPLSPSAYQLRLPSPASARGGGMPPYRAYTVDFAPPAPTPRLPGPLTPHHFMSFPASYGSLPSPIGYSSAPPLPAPGTSAYDRATSATTTADTTAAAAAAAAAEAEAAPYGTEVPAGYTAESTSMMYHDNLAVAAPPPPSASSHMSPEGFAVFCHPSYAHAQAQAQAQVQAQAADFPAARARAATVPGSRPDWWLSGSMNTHGIATAPASSCVSLPPASAGELGSHTHTAHALHTAHPNTASILPVGAHVPVSCLPLACAGDDGALMLTPANTNTHTDTHTSSSTHRQQQI